MGTVQRRLLRQERYLGGVGSASECCWTSWILEGEKWEMDLSLDGQKARAAEGLEWETEGPRNALDQAAFVLTPFMVYKEIQERSER